MSPDELSALLIIVAAVLIMFLLALLIWATGLLLRIQHLERKLTAFRPRDGSGRPLRERL